MIGKRAIVAGATGSIGRLVVQTLFADPRVDRVTAVVRETVPPERATELWGKQCDNRQQQLVQVVVNYETLLNGDDHDDQKKRLQKAFAGSDAFVTALGVYSNKATEDQMDQVECGYNQSLASIAHDSGAKRGAYLSGQGVQQPILEGRAFSRFGRSKGRAEESLANIFSGPEEAHVSCRPAAIMERPGPPVYGFIDGTLLKLWPFYLVKDTDYGITALDIAKGMVQGSLFDNDAQVNGNTIWENPVLKEAARRYDAHAPSPQDSSS